jgi:nitroimidazol reductase NimA-like FMN-containing flavoprotein (pyridoxamine 5'-phosphate oxidase superfamily)
VVGNTEVLPDQFATRYESVITSGGVEEVSGEERQQALEGLLAKYSSEYYSEGQDYIKAKDKLTRVFRVSIENISGKARR